MQFGSHHRGSGIVQKLSNCDFILHWGYVAFGFVERLSYHVSIVLPLLSVCETLNFSLWIVTWSKSEWSYFFKDSGRESLLIHFTNLYAGHVTLATSQLPSFPTLFYTVTIIKSFQNFSELEIRFQRYLIEKFAVVQVWHFFRQRIYAMNRDLDFVSRGLLRVHLYLVNTLVSWEWPLIDKIS